MPRNAKYLILSIALAAAIAMPAVAQKAPSQEKVFQAIHKCLPVAEVGDPYKLSLASFVKSKSNAWLLIRAYENNLKAPSYSIVEVTPQSCKNYHHYPVLDISKTPVVPKPVLKTFQAVTTKDVDIAWKIMQKEVLSNNPGKSLRQLQREGAFGMDGL